MANILNGQEVESMKNLSTQVYKVTHDGELRLPFMNRSFISFTYGGKYIEDFNLIAYTNGDRMERDAYASFDDLSSTYDTINGLFYWGSYYRSNSLTLNLFTDEITERQLDDFKHWFRAGEIKELILAEHPNRAIMARVSLPPQISMLPFEKTVTVTVGNLDYQTSTTVYKGDITLEFVMDEPFWYAKLNILGVQDVIQGYYKESWIDANGVEVSVRDNKDALKIVYEDRIPLGSTTLVSVFLGGDTYATVSYEAYSLIVKSIDKDTYYTAGVGALVDAVKAGYFKVNSVGELTFALNDDGSHQDTEENYTYYYGATIALELGDSWIGGRIGGADLTGTSTEGLGIPLSVSESANLYYAGTAPSPVKLRFTMRPVFGNEHFIISPNNKYGTPTLPYNTITLTATKEHVFQFSLPTIYFSYNLVLKILLTDSIMHAGNAWLLVRETIRDTIKDPYIRAWSNKMIDYYDNNGSGIITADNVANIGSLMRAIKYIFIGKEGDSTMTSIVEGLPATFTFDGKTGSAIGKFTIRNPFKSDFDMTSGIDDIILRINSYRDDADSFINIEQNVGDMVKSSYLILDERNILDEKMLVQSWTSLHPDYAYKITHNIQNGLLDLHFEFKNLYL